MIREGVASDDDLLALARDLGSPIVSAEPCGWGDAAATSRIGLADGRVVAVRRVTAADPRNEAERVAAIMRGVARAGLPVPSPMVAGTADAVWLVTPWMVGETGAAWLHTPECARHLAGRMGDAAGRLRTVELDDLGLDMYPGWPGELAQRSETWLAAIRGDLEPAAVQAVDLSLGWLASSPPRRPTFVHGDFAPINVIVDPDGAIVALLDFEYARLGPPLSDVAWWGWVVRHHHPDAWSASWPTFCAAAGVEVDPSTDAEIRALQAIRLLEFAATATDPAARARWLGRLSDAVTW